MIAAMMTAANLGARTTGWGFVVFVIGSLSWIVVGLSSGQTNLLATNAFLTLVNLVGIWRWLGRQRAYEDGGRSARDASRKSSAPTLFTATGIAGMSVDTKDGRTVGKTVEALIECRTGEVSYVVVASPAAGGIAEQLRAVPREAIVFHCDGLSIDLSNAAFEALAPLKDGDWPDTAVPQVAQAA
ncbi:PRC-barrel domain containing protein [Sphingomonas sp. CA1-15]|uniref:PRC-barrel domain containing protein n=2 Tax=Sphingomonas immobilis TaxID=3063997 RepID=A0ABT8ZWM0_9SPHN|nr:PRC-barrel domain containing protein [Sphingomonas sp. CA1-15]MDO7841948.1 PRC-barrel domain containing protein [Sphingomonas sp. CA1-15]